VTQGETVPQPVKDFGETGTLLGELAPERPLAHTELIRH
jgi:hypothetical protein